MARRPPAGGEPLSAADASNVHIDAADQVNVFLLAGMLGTGGFVASDGNPDLSALRTAIAARLDRPALLRFSQRVDGRAGHLVWVRSPPDLVHHVRAAAPVRGREGLASLCAHLMTVPLPGDRPLWQLLVVPGASPHGPGMVLRVHHAMADGAAGVRLLEVLFDTVTEEVPAPDRLPPRRRAQARTGPRGRWTTLVDGARRTTAVLRGRLPSTALLGQLSDRRDVAFTSVDLGRLRAFTHAAGATVNDALLSAVAAAATAGLSCVGETAPDPLPASVPVALPDRGGSGNAVGVMMVPLPARDPDPYRRLATVAERTRGQLAGARAQGTLELTRSRWGSRIFARLARRQRFVALFVTNVRGPDRVLRIAGAPLLQAWPVAQLQGNVRLGVAAMSYAGRLGCTVHTDARALPAAPVARTLGEELERLAVEAGPA